MNKTSIVTTHECGCVERRWLFGREMISTVRGCLFHDPRLRRQIKSYWPASREAA